MTGTTAAKAWDDVAEEHIQRTGAYDIDPEAIADAVIEAVNEVPSRDYVESYVRDRMWYRRGVR